MAGCGFEAAAYAHLLCSNEWASRFIHENLGPLHIHDVFNTVENEITDDIALQVPRYEGGYLYPNEGPGIGMELNPAAIPGMVTKGKQSLTVGVTGD
jgi:L-alanine-DL-glutamate epimerase-like enolase superfamily enzyme